jgi:hypothetical protein
VAARSIAAAVPPAAPPPSDSHPLALTPTQRVVKKTIVVVADIEPELVGTAVVPVASAGNTVAVLLLPFAAEYSSLDSMMIVRSFLSFFPNPL